MSSTMAATHDEIELMKDPKYRAYVNIIDKTLKCFDSAHEWPDLVTSLSKLQKVLNDKFNLVPRRIKISRSLGICVLEACPQGVHMKALEIYDFIFRSIGPDRLANEFFLYSGGLFPLFRYACEPAKNYLLALYETYYIPLGEKMVPSLNGFLCSILVDLEGPPTDVIVRVNNLLDMVCDGVGPIKFYSHMWQCILDSSTIRLSAIKFLLGHFGQHSESIMNHTYASIMVSALCSCLKNDSDLVQRSALDFLQIAVPLNEHENITSNDMKRLLEHSLYTFLQQDMSLNRRLYAWLLGMDSGALPRDDFPLVNEPLQGKLTQNVISYSNVYFELHCKTILTLAMKNIFLCAANEKGYNPGPCNIMLALLDRKCVGCSILNDILYEMLRFMRVSVTVDTSEEGNALKDWRFLLSRLDPEYILSYCLELYVQACNLAIGSEDANVEKNKSLREFVGSGQPQLSEVCQIITFILKNMLNDELLKHMPGLFINVLIFLTDNCDQLPPQRITLTLEMLGNIFSEISHLEQEHVNIPLDGDDEHMVKGLNMSKEFKSSGSIFMDEYLKHYFKFYSAFMSASCLMNGSVKSASILFDALRIKSHNESEQCRAKTLEALLKYIFLKQVSAVATTPPSSQAHFPSTTTSSSVMEYWMQQGVGAKHPSPNSTPWAQAVSRASHLLLRLFHTKVMIIPTGNNASKKSNNKERSGSVCNDGDDEETVVPFWLKILIVSCCWLGNAAGDVQLIGISTLLDLCSALEVVSSRHSRPLLQPDQVEFLKFRTNVFQVIVHWLWENLGNGSRCAQSGKLLYKLQHMLYPLHIVEDCLRNLLLCQSFDESARFGSLKKFVTLWRMKREDKGHPTRDISCELMLKVLDCLENNSNNEGYESLKVESENWLVESLERGDFCRIADPLLIILMDESTIRASVRYAHIYRSQNILKTNCTYSIAYKPNIGNESSIIHQVTYDFGSGVISSSPITAALDHCQASFISRSNKQSGPLTFDIHSTSAKKCSDVPQSESSDKNGTIIENVVQDVLTFLIESTVYQYEREVQLEKQSKRNARNNVGKQYSHLLLYCGLYDSHRMKYILNTFAKIIGNESAGHLFLKCAASSTISRECNLAKHENSVLCQWDEASLQTQNSSFNAEYRQAIYLEALVNVCLLYARSYYPNLPLLSKLSRDDVAMNRQVQIYSVKLLHVIFSRLVEMAKNDKIVAHRIGAMLKTCKVQKLVLCLVLQVTLFTPMKNATDVAFPIFAMYSHAGMDSLHENNSTATATIGSSNEHHIRDLSYEHIVEHIVTSNADIQPACTITYSLSKDEQSLQNNLLKLLLSSIQVEYYSSICGTSSTNKGVDNNAYSNGKMYFDMFSIGSETHEEIKYNNGVHVMQQPMFAYILMKALRPIPHLIPSHKQWTSFFITSLSYMEEKGSGRIEALSAVIRALCTNIKHVASLRKNTNENLPPHYLLFQLESLNKLCVLLLEIIDGACGEKKKHKEEHHLSLNIFSPLLESAAILWSYIARSNENDAICGYVKREEDGDIIKTKTLALLDFLAVNYNSAFVISIAVVWGKLSECDSTHTLINIDQTTYPAIFSKKNWSSLQTLLMNLLLCLNCMNRTDDILVRIHKILKYSIQNETIMDLEYSLMEFLRYYLERVHIPAAQDFWRCLSCILKDATCFAPTSQFLLLSMIDHFVHCNDIISVANKKYQKDVQDVIIKLIECLNQTAGLSLGPISWLRRNLTVNESTFSKYSGCNYSKGEISYMGQIVIAEFFTPLVDAAFASEEDKERLIPLLTAIMGNVTPYLKSNSAKNAAFFYACSRILASISTYPCTRKTWKKDAMELLLDPNFFQMEHRALPSWMSTVDNLMSQDDNVSFLDFLRRVCGTSQKHGIFNPFANRDQECKLKSHLLKRLAFVILCCCKDQFKDYIYDLQGVMADCLKSSYNVQCQGFLFFRALILRMSAKYTAPLWPAINDWVYQILLSLELYLDSNDTDHLSTNYQTAFDLPVPPSPTTSLASTNPPVSHEKWLQVVLSAVKFLKFAIQLPADTSPQFQANRWMFVGNKVAGGWTNFPSKLLDYLNKKFGELETLPCELLPQECNMRSVQDLHPFFTAITKNVEMGNPVPIQQLELELQMDFIEPFSLPSAL